MAEKLYFPGIYLVPVLTGIIFENQSTMKSGQNNSQKRYKAHFQ